MATLLKAMDVLCGRLEHVEGWFSMPITTSENGAPSASNAFSDCWMTTFEDVTMARSYWWRDALYVNDRVAVSPGSTCVASPCKGDNVSIGHRNSSTCM
jgi:hypothetical protein